MGMQVFANGMSIACKAADGKTIAAMPDVCLSPPTPPAGPVPIPYPNTAMASDTTKGSKTVQINGEEVMLKDSSTFKQSNGDEAATKSLGMGVVTACIQGEVSFAAWSMDVKFEGANVPRHLDLTLHNEQCVPANTPPWPYMDSQSLSSTTHPCNKSGDAKKVHDNCGNPPEDDHSKDCCDARKCMLVPENADKCCGGKTPHHLIPVGEFSDPRPPKSSGKFPRRGASRFSGYEGRDAPCICVEGPTHNSRDATGNLMEHGRTGAAFAVLREKALGDRKEYTYAEASPIGAEAAHLTTGCDEKCLKAQIDKGHKKMGIKPDSKLRRSRQSKGGKGFKLPSPATPGVK